MDEPQNTPAVGTPPMPPTKPPPKRRDVIAGLVIILCAVGLCIFAATSFADMVRRAASTPMPSAPSAPTAEPDKHIEAGIICEQFVTKRLKAPSTAKFASIWDGIKAVKEGTRYTLRSWVDSQNGFGAMIRTQFNCVVEDQGDTWKLIDLTME